LEVNLVQRMHKSGRRVKYRVVVVVGNRDGIFGVGHASTRDIGSAIKKAVTVAQLNVIEVARGCGSWECGCGRSHSVPFEVTGKSGSVKFSIKPAPRGLGLASAGISRTILRMAGIQDAWTRTDGQTRTTLNFSLAVMDALKQTTKMVMSDKYRERVTIGKAGGVSG
ncbi:MAG: 30S ribosomal protein S5, partial [Methanobacteriota archaeon]